MDKQTGWSDRWPSTGRYRCSDLIPNPDASKPRITRRTASVCAGQMLCGGPARTRTWDLILISKMQGTAVLTAVSAGRGRPKRPKLCALVAFNYVVSSWHATRLIFRTPPSDLVRTYIALHHRCREGQLGKAGRSPPKFRAPWAALGSGLVVATNRPRRHCGSHDLQWVVPFSRPELEHSAERDRQADAGL
jgi:hypothetical protein